MHTLENDIRIVITLQDNDFYVDMCWLGEFIVQIMKYFNSHQIDKAILYDAQYKACLKKVLISMFTNIYTLSYLVDPDKVKQPFDVDCYTKDIQHIAKWFESQLYIYLTEEDFKHVMEDCIDTSLLGKSYNDITDFNEFQRCDGNAEFLIIHCCKWETTCLVV